MTRNQLLPNYPRNWSGDVMFTVADNGNISPTTPQTINRGQTVLSHADSTSNAPFNGKVCARQDDVCQCSTLVNGVSSGHMAIGTTYTISSTAPIGGDFEIYSITSGGVVASAINGNIHIGG